jgi:hypothetical protein
MTRPPSHKVIAAGESSTNAAMAAAVLPRFADVLELAAGAPPRPPRAWV